MIYPLDVGGTPFEGIVLIAIVVRLFSMWRTWRKYPVSLFEWLLFANAIAFLVFLGLQNIEVVKPWLLVFVVVSLFLFMFLVTQAQLFAAFAVVAEMVANMVTYFIIGTDYNSAVWVAFGATLFASLDSVQERIAGSFRRKSRRFILFTNIGSDVETKLIEGRDLRRAKVAELEQKMSKLGLVNNRAGLDEMMRLLKEKTEVERALYQGELKLASFQLDINAARRLGRGDTAAEAYRRAIERAYGS
jgi:hypothetical protein